MVQNHYVSHNKRNKNMAIKGILDSYNEDLYLKKAYVKMLVLTGKFFYLKNISRILCFPMMSNKGA